MLLRLEQDADKSRAANMQAIEVHTCIIRSSLIMETKNWKQKQRIVISVIRVCVGTSKEQELRKDDDRKSLRRGLNK